MAAFIIPAITSILGGLLSHSGQNSDIEKQNALNLQNEEQSQRARYDMGLPQYNRGEQGRAVRGSLARGVIEKYLKGYGVDPALLNQISTPTAAPPFEFQPGQEQATHGLTGAAGNFLSGIAPYIGLQQSLSGGGDQTPVGFTRESPTAYGRGSSTATTPGSTYLPGGGPIKPIAPEEGYSS